MKHSIWILVLILAACGPVPTSPLEPTLQGATPVSDSLRTAAICDAIAGEDTSALARITLLETLQSRDANCSKQINLETELYRAYIAYGDEASAAGERDSAMRAYGTALGYAPDNDTRAADELAKLQNSPAIATAAPDDCPDDLVLESLSTIPDYNSQPGDIRSLAQLDLIRAVIYEPRDHPGTAFFRATPSEAFDTELDMITEAGFNAIRVRLRYDALFHCAGDGAVPIPDAIRRLDTLIETAAANGLGIIMVLNHAPDLGRYPLYDAPTHTQAQTAWITNRYADEPTIWLWDLRERGDIHYEGYGRERVIQWLATTADLVRDNAPQHPVAASWEENISDIIPLVDVVGIYHEDDLESLRQKIALVRAETDKPIFLSSVGYTIVAGDELAQRDVLYEVLQAAEANELLGWAIYRAFDHPLNVCNNLECERYGLWNISYFPKRALDAATATITGEIPGED